MALRAVVKLDVDDSDFNKFVANFDRYKAELASTPDIWKDVGYNIQTTMTGLVEGMEDASAASEAVVVATSVVAVESEKASKSTRAQSTELEKIAKQNAKVTTETNKQAKSWHDMARDAGAFAGKVVDATRSLLRWGELTGLISGVMGLGGLWGIDRLAISAGGQRKEALGLGATPGEVAAFKTNFGRILDPEAFLSNVNRGINDVTSPQFLAMRIAGAHPENQTDAATAALDTIQALKKRVDALPSGALFGAAAHAQQLDQLMPLEELRRLRNTPQGELDEYTRHARADTGPLGMSDRVAKAWQDLQVQLHRAGQEIELSFINGLVKLAPQIEHLSDSFVKLVDTVLGNKSVKSWIDSLAEGIKWLAEYMGTPAFREDVDHFVTAVGDLAGKVVHFVESVAHIIEALDNGAGWIETITGKKDGANGPLGDNEGSPGSPAWRRAHPEHGGPLAPWDLSPYEPNNPIPTPDSGSRWDYLKPWKWGIHKESYNPMEDMHGLPRGLLESVENAESGGNPYAISSAGAVGAFQFTRAAWDQYGRGGNPLNEQDSAFAAARYYKDLLSEFHGDIAKAAAGYNWGPANVEHDIATYGDRWRQHLPAETQGYVSRVTSGVGYAQGNGLMPNGKPANVKVDITIHSPPGANPSVSASQLVT